MSKKIINKNEVYNIFCEELRHKPHYFLTVEWSAIKSVLCEVKYVFVDRILPKSEMGNIYVFIDASLDRLVEMVKENVYEALQHIMDLTNYYMGLCIEMERFESCDNIDKVIKHLFIKIKIIRDKLLNG